MSRGYLSSVIVVPQTIAGVVRAHCSAFYIAIISDTAGFPSLCAVVERIAEVNGVGYAHGKICAVSPNG
jgi:hypothetical protein